MQNNQINSAQWDVIVIGAGLGGLSSAAYCAAAGKKTLLLESYSVLGGCSHVFRRKPNWEFDVGVHYVGDCGENGEVPNLLRGLGLEDKITWLPLDNKAFDIIVGPDLEIKIPLGWDNYLHNLIEQFPNEEKGLRRFVSVVQKIGDALDIGRSTSSTSDMLKLFKDSGTAAPWVMAPLPSLFAACGLSPKLSLVLSVQCGALATSSLVMPVALYAGFLKHYVVRGGWYPKGGGQMLAAGFAEVVLTHGGEIRTDTKVDRIIIENGQAVGVELEGGEIIHSKAIISNADIKRTYRDLVGHENLPRSIVKKNENWKMSWPLINAYFGVELDLSETTNSNYFVIPNWKAAKSYLSLANINSRMLSRAHKRNAFDWANDFAENQPAYIQSSTRRDPSNVHSAPSGHSAIEVQTLAPFAPKLWGITEEQMLTGEYREHSNYQEIKEIVTDGLLQRVEQVYPEAKAKVKLRELGTPATQQRYTLSSGGAAYGLESRITQFGLFRPGTKTVIKGLYLAGCSTKTGAGTVGSMLSGVFAASEVVGRDLHAEVRAGKVIADKSLLSSWPVDFDPLKASIKMGRQSKIIHKVNVADRLII
ncbi:NAD(P)/FAD-dependent oxidoreductase [Acinetobacter pittii]|uniref:NAD(P)/FAD-dependent oxidoreductase n=1 Tax=Acinetobacter pittii TaxID=48296 RepID=A0A3R9SUL5_ACIPI|nr:MULTISPECIES: NAD(P)/FAD-dependent oxidoreductase [Acinetobacter]MDR0068751.1 NAD(P)/FAD-dependent oxidoreductase [Acinetobacter sp. 11520]MDU6285493.1 NAD(P)/FAD-dependent oxidoreductase [Acinetobacter sp.]AMM29039.1 FAD-dependent oxidoreductase [Acinetobacter pittii]KQE15830.1 FAD-dependent oxidoreductase [Acinetobacter pittii]KQF34599.1 FAD-dependent oxidoreductase [Acinetobacter pittii]